MTTFLLIIHLFVCILLIGIVLVQGGKGAELGSAFGGGSSQTLFGGRGAATFLGKMTTVVAIVFMVTSLLLAVMSVKDTSVTSSSVIGDQQQRQAEQPVLPLDAAEKAGVKPTQPEAPQQTPPQQ